MRSACLSSVSAVLVLSATLWAAKASAEEVTLTFNGGGLSVTGELVASDANSYVVRSPRFGVMALEASRFSCAGAACPRQAAGALGIHGSNTIGAQLMPSTIEKFAEQNGYAVEKVVGTDPEEVKYKLSRNGSEETATIDLQSHGSNTAPPSILERKAQIGEMSRPIKPEEVKSISDAGIKLNTHVFALDGVVVFVSPQNPVDTLTLEQIAKIFAGKIKNWSEVGGSSADINVYARDAKSGTFDTFDNLVLKPNNLKLSPTAQRIESSPDLSDQTARDPNGIGFAGFAYTRNAKPLSISSSCGIVSPPEEFLVKTEEYPLSRRLFLHTVDPLPPLGEKLIDFALSDDVQDTVSKTGFVDQRIDMQTFNQQAKRLGPALTVPDKDFDVALMRELVSGLKKASRLSINFRFRKNSAVLDEKARQDIPRLARFLKRDPSRFKQVLLLGFTDNTGTFEANRNLAYGRAAGFKTALVAQGIPANQLVAKGYGSLLPIGCNSTTAGQDVNRRVEVWVE